MIDHNQKINHQSALAINISKSICIYVIIYAAPGRRDFCWILLIRGEEPDASIVGTLGFISQGRNVSEMEGHSCSLLQGGHLQVSKKNFLNTSIDISYILKSEILCFKEALTFGSYLWQINVFLKRDFIFLPLMNSAVDLKWEQNQTPARI